MDHDERRQDESRLGTGAGTGTGTGAPRDADVDTTTNMDSREGDDESHATTGGAAAAGAATGGLVGMAAGPMGAAVGAVAGAVIGAAAERIMHSDDDTEGERAGLESDRDSNVLIEDRSQAGMATEPAQHGTGGPAGGLAGGLAGEGGQRIQLREEELAARKEMRQAGEVEVRKDVVEEQRTLQVPVTREEVVIERHPVDRRPADTTSFAEGSETIRVPVREEEISVEKRPVVREEIEVGTRTVQDTQQVSADVRREEARIEETGDVQVRGGGTTGSPGAGGQPGSTRHDQ